MVSFISREEKYLTCPWNDFHRYEVTIEVELSPMSFRQLSLIPSRPARNPKVESKKSFTKSRIKATNGIEVGIGHNGLEWIEVRGNLICDRLEKIRI